MSIYFEDYSSNKVSKDILGNIKFAYMWGIIHKRNCPEWLSVKLIKRR